MEEIMLGICKYILVHTSRLNLYNMMKGSMANLTLAIQIIVKIVRYTIRNRQILKFLPPPPPKKKKLLLNKIKVSMYCQQSLFSEESINIPLLTSLQFNKKETLFLKTL